MIKPKFQLHMYHLHHYLCAKNSILYLSYFHCSLHDLWILMIWIHLRKCTSIFILISYRPDIRPFYYIRFIPRNMLLLEKGLKAVDEGFLASKSSVNQDKNRRTGSIDTLMQGCGSGLGLDKEPDRVYLYVRIRILACICLDPDPFFYMLGSGSLARICSYWIPALYNVCSVPDLDLYMLGSE